MKNLERKVYPNFKENLKSIVYQSFVPRRIKEKFSNVSFKQVQDETIVILLMCGITLTLLGYIRSPKNEIPYILLSGIYLSTEACNYLMGKNLGEKLPRATFPIEFSFEIFYRFYNFIKNK